MYLHFHLLIFKSNEEAKARNYAQSEREQDIMMTVVGEENESISFDDQVHIFNMH